MCWCDNPGRLSLIGVLYSSSHACCGKDHGDNEDCDCEENVTFMLFTARNVDDEDDA